MSSKRAIRRAAKRRQCGHKQRHDHRDAAWAALKALVRAKGPQGALQPYRCPHCAGWHFGHVGGGA